MYSSCDNPPFQGRGTTQMGAPDSRCEHPTGPGNPWPAAPAAVLNSPRYLVAARTGLSCSAPVTVDAGAQSEREQRAASRCYLITPEIAAKPDRTPPFTGRGSSVPCLAVRKTTGE